MTTTITENYRFNNDQTITTPSGDFLVEQRNAGFADNDGKWVVSQLPDLYWSSIGTLTERRPSKLLGVFNTATDAAHAIDTAQLQPEHSPHRALN